jgi:hypothetical protein
VISSCSTFVPILFYTTILEHAHFYHDGAVGKASHPLIDYLIGKPNDVQYISFPVEAAVAEFQGCYSSRS